MRLGRASERVKALRTIPLLRDLDRSDLEQIAKVAYRVTREPGETLLRQGDLGTELFLVVQGTAQIERDGQPIATVGRNTVIGEMALIDGHPRSATITATTPCELLAIPYDQFWTFVDRVPSVQRRLLITLSRRVRDLEQAVAPNKSLT